MNFAAAANRLAGVAGRSLGWTPDVFWGATPAELAAIANSGPEAPGGGASLTRTELTNMMERERHG